MRGLVLEGGGIKGAYHAGALKALFENDIYFAGVMGTSIGALNGALIAQNDFQTCYDLWKNAKPSLVVDINEEEYENLLSRKYTMPTIKYFIKLVGKTIDNRGFSIDKLYDLVSKNVDEEKLRKSNILFGLITVNISKGWEGLELFIDDIEKGELIEYVVASAYYPGFNRPEIKGQRYMDGGMYDNLPINPLIRRGFDEIVVIRTSYQPPQQTIIDDNIQIDMIEPTENLGKAFNFSPKKVEYLLKLGYFDAQRFLNRYLGRKYYINSTSRAFNEDLLVSFQDYLNNHSNQSFNNYMIKMKENYRLPIMCSNLETLIVHLESLAIKFGVERFKIYSIKKFIELVKKHIKIDESNMENIVEKFLISYKYKENEK